MEIVSYHPNLKIGDATKAIDYRPINMLPSTLILFEKILSHYLTFYLRYNRYITQHLYGFLFSIFWIYFCIVPCLSDVLSMTYLELLGAF